MLVATKHIKKSFLLCSFLVFLFSLPGAYAFWGEVSCAFGAGGCASSPAPLSTPKKSDPAKEAKKSDASESQSISFFYNKLLSVLVYLNYQPVVKVTPADTKDPHYNYGRWTQYLFEPKSSSIFGPAEDLEANCKKTGACSQTTKNAINAMQKISAEGGFYKRYNPYFFESLFPEYLEKRFFQLGASFGGDSSSGNTCADPESIAQSIYQAYVFPLDVPPSLVKVPIWSIFSGGSYEQITRVDDDGDASQSAIDFLSATGQTAAATAAPEPSYLSGLQTIFQARNNSDAAAKMAVLCLKALNLTALAQNYGAAASATNSSIQTGLYSYSSLNPGNLITRSRSFFRGNMSGTDQTVGDYLSTQPWQDTAECSVYIKAPDDKKGWLPPASFPACAQDTVNALNHNAAFLQFVFGLKMAWSDSLMGRTCPNYMYPQAGSSVANSCTAGDAFHVFSLALMDYNKFIYPKLKDLWTVFPDFGKESCGVSDWGAEDCFLAQFNAAQAKKALILSSMSKLRTDNIFACGAEASSNPYLGLGVGSSDSDQVANALYGNPYTSVSCPIYKGMLSRIVANNLFVPFLRDTKNYPLFASMYGQMTGQLNTASGILASACETSAVCSSTLSVGYPQVIGAMQDAKVLLDNLVQSIVMSTVYKHIPSIPDFTNLGNDLSLVQDTPIMADYLYNALAYETYFDASSSPLPASLASVLYPGTPIFNNFESGQLNNEYCSGSMSPAALDAAVVRAQQSCRAKRKMLSAQHARDHDYVSQNDDFDLQMECLDYKVRPNVVQKMVGDCNALRTQAAFFKQQLEKSTEQAGKAVVGHETFEGFVAREQSLPLQLLRFFDYTAISFYERMNRLIGMSGLSDLFVPKIQSTSGVFYSEGRLYKDLRPGEVYISSQDSATYETKSSIYHAFPEKIYNFGQIPNPFKLMGVRQYVQNLSQSFYNAFEKQRQAVMLATMSFTDSFAYILSKRFTQKAFGGLRSDWRTQCIFGISGTELKYSGFGGDDARNAHNSTCLSQYAFSGRKTYFPGVPQMVGNAQSGSGLEWRNNTVQESPVELDHEILQAISDIIDLLYRMELNKERILLSQTTLGLVQLSGSGITQKTIALKQNLEKQVQIFALGRHITESLDKKLQPSVSSD